MSLQNLVVAVLVLIARQAHAAPDTLQRALLATTDRVSRLVPGPVDRIPELIATAELARSLGEVARARALVGDAVNDLMSLPVMRHPKVEGYEDFHGVIELLVRAAVADGCERVERWVGDWKGHPLADAASLTQRFAQACTPVALAISGKFMPAIRAERVEKGSLRKRLRPFDNRSANIAERARNLRILVSLASLETPTEDDRRQLDRFEASARKRMRADRRAYRLRAAEWELRPVH